MLQKKPLFADGFELGLKVLESRALSIEPSKPVPTVNQQRLYSQLLNTASTSIIYSFAICPALT